MDAATVRIVLEEATSSPAGVDLNELDEAIRWMEGRINVRRPEKGADQVVHYPQHEEAAAEMRTLRRLLVQGDFFRASESAQRALTAFNS
jgi:hypothetical protein